MNERINQYFIHQYRHNTVQEAQLSPIDRAMRRVN